MNLIPTYKADRVILHIGPPKTGTTKLQATLKQNRSRLADRGILFPDLRPRPESQWDAGKGEPTGMKHDFLLLLALADPSQTLIFQRYGDRLKASGLADLQAECIDSLNQELNSTNPATVIFSSESFGNLPFRYSDGFMSLSKYLSSIAPVVDVVIYVRHPIAHARSHQQHMLRSGVATLDQLDEPWVYPYMSTCELLMSAFGVDRTHVVAYRRDMDDGFDIVRSFGDVTGVHLGDLDPVTGHGNAGVSMEAALLLDSLNRLQPQPGAMTGELNSNRFAASYLARVPGQPFRLSPTTENEIESISAPGLEFLKERFGIYLDDLVDPPAGPLWEQSTIDEIVERMQRLAGAGATH